MNHWALLDELFGMLLGITFPPLAIADTNALYGFKLLSPVYGFGVEYVIYKVQISAVLRE